MHETEESSVTESVTPRPWTPSTPRCLRCGEVLAESRDDSRTCSDACRAAVSRRRRTLGPLVRLVLLALAGESPPVWVPFWGLLRLTVRRERARLHAEQQARRLPGGAR